MKNYILYIIGILVLIGGCSPKVYDSTRWQKNEVQLDGESAEWDIPLKYYDKTTKLNYGFANDKYNLYFLARTSEESTTSQIMGGGLVIEFDTVASSDDYPFSINYPVMMERPKGGPPQGERKNNNGAPEERGQQPSDMSQKPARIPNNEIKIAGFDSMNDASEAVVSFSKSSGIVASCNTDSEGILFYELAIPFDTFFKPEITGNDSTMVFSCKITLQGNSLRKQGPPPGDGGMGGPPSGGGMGGPPPSGGGMGGPPPGGMGGGPEMDSNNSGSSKTVIKQEFRLSYKMD